MLLCVGDGLGATRWIRRSPGSLGREITIGSSSFNDQIPVGGKLTFIYDAGDDVVRICTRTAPTQRSPWRMDLAAGCNVALTFTRGTRYCTLEDVKAGDGEVLSSCHRLRSREVALKPSKPRGAVELKDMIVFLLSAERGQELHRHPHRLALAGHRGRLGSRPPLITRALARRLSALLLPFAATAALGASFVTPESPRICQEDGWRGEPSNVPVEISRLPGAARHASTWINARRARTGLGCIPRAAWRAHAGSTAGNPCRPADRFSRRRTPTFGSCRHSWSEPAHVRGIERFGSYVVASFAHRLSGQRLHEILRCPADRIRRAGL